MLDTDNLIMDGDRRLNTGTVSMQRSNWVVDREGYVDSCFMAEVKTVRFSEAGGYFGFFNAFFKASTDGVNYKNVYSVNGFIPMQIDGYEVPVLGYEHEICYDRNTREAVIKLNRTGIISRVRYYVSNYFSNYPGVTDFYCDYEHANYATDEIRVPLDSTGYREVIIFPEDAEGRWIAGGETGLQGYYTQVASNIVEDDREWIEYSDVSFYCAYDEGSFNSSLTVPTAYQYTRKCLTPADKPGSVLRIVNPFGPDTPYANDFPDNVLDNDEYYIDINVVDKDHCYLSLRPEGLKAFYDFYDEWRAIFPVASADRYLRYGYKLEELMEDPNPYIQSFFTPIKDNRISFNEGKWRYSVILPGEVSVSDILTTDDDTYYYELSLSDKAGGVSYVLMPGTITEFEKWAEEIRNGAESVSYINGNEKVTGKVQIVLAEDLASRADSKRIVKIDVTHLIGDEYNIIAVPFDTDANYYLPEYVTVPIKNYFKFYGNAHFIYNENDNLARMGLNEGCRVDYSEELNAMRFVNPFGTYGNQSKYMFMRFGDTPSDASQFYITSNCNILSYLFTNYINSRGYNMAYHNRESLGIENYAVCYRDGDTFYLPNDATILYDRWTNTIDYAGDLTITIKRPEPAGSEEVEIDEVLPGEEFDNDAEVEYYDLYGRRVTNPGHGMYIRRQGSSVSKILIK